MICERCGRQVADGDAVIVDADSVEAEWCSSCVEIARSNGEEVIEV